MKMDMIMRSLNFKFKRILLALTVILAGAFNGVCQDNHNIYVEKYKTAWNNLIPKYTKVQFAGGMGFLSAGSGWHYGKNKQWETDLYLGFIPKFDTDKARVTFTVKQNFIPWNLPLNKNFSLDALTCGAYINTILNGQYWVNQPDKYPDSYYTFSTKMRFNIFAGQRLTYQLPPDKRRFRKSISFFYELGTNELYLLSAFGNNYLKPWDYIHLSLGLKFDIL